MAETPSTNWTLRNMDFVAPPRRVDLHESQLDGEAIVSDPHTGSIFRLNRTALAIWRACDGKTTTQEIARQQSESFAINLDKALDHVEQVVAVFAEAQLLDLSADQRAAH